MHWLHRSQRDGRTDRQRHLRQRDRRPQRQRAKRWMRQHRLVRPHLDGHRRLRQQGPIDSDHSIVDTTAPTISDVPEATVECPGSTAPSATGVPTASDTCGSVTVTHSDGAQSAGCGNTGSFVRTWTATDACGNKAQSTQTITIVDTTAPTISDVPDATVECSGSTDPSVTGTATGSDSGGSG